MEHATTRLCHAPIRLFGAALLLGGSAASSALTIGAQDFNQLDHGAATLGSQLADGQALPNGGARNADPGAGLRFDTFWYATRGNDSGPATSDNDTDQIGVHALAGTGYADNAADGTPVAAGSEHNYAASDGDGRIGIHFEPLDLRDLVEVTLSLDYWIADTSYEGGDAFSIVLDDGNSSVVLLDYDAAALAANARVDQPGTPWSQFSAVLDPVLEFTLDPGTIALVVGIDTNAAGERVQIDNVRFTGALSVPLPASLALLGGPLIGLLGARRTRVPRRTATH